jgi:hypothetical protein
MIRALCALLLVALSLAAGGCSQAPRGDRWAAALGAANAEADQRLDRGDVAGARAALAAAASAEAPRAAAASGRRLALQDTYFRLAQLALSAHDAAAALGYADSGLALGNAPHLFVANLLVARGAAHEALGDARAAAEDYHRALTMNETLLREALPREAPQ